MYANPNVIGRAKTKDCRMIPGHSSPPLSRPAIFLSVCAFFLLECPSRVVFPYLLELTFQIPMGRIKGVLNFNSSVWAVIFGNQIITGWLIAGTCLFKTLSGHSFRVKKNYRPMFLSFQTVYSRKLQTNVEKNYPKILLALWHSYD